MNENETRRRILKEKKKFEKQKIKENYQKRKTNKF